MSNLIKIDENEIRIAIEVTSTKDVRLLHLSTAPFPDFQLWDERLKSKYRLVEVHISGENQDDHHGSKHTGTNPGKRLRFHSMEDERVECGRHIIILLKDEITKLAAACHFHFFDGVPVLRTWTTVTNEGEQPAGLEYVSSFALTGIDKEGLSKREQKMTLHIPHNTWYGEAQWQAYSLNELGLHTVNEFSMKRLSYGSTGTWSSSQFAPCAFIENTECGTGLVWQIEHNGSWHWEISDIANVLYVQLSGPTDAEHSWWKNLAPGETFVSVTAAVGAIKGGVDEANRQMTRYRRKIRRQNEDNRNLPVIFNDYMNCLFGDPTTDKLLPIIDAAAEAGCEIFCIDCGWYSDGYWWDGVGEWLPSKARFPNGIEEVLQYIRSKGMIPGLWLEIEVMGIHCPLAELLPDDWFFMRHGSRVIDHSRYQMDFRNTDVVAYADSVIDRLVQDYGVGYIKMDYNINAGIGTDCSADSYGEGLLGHNRAYLAWIDQVFERYPDLIIENCGSGGMRVDYAMLSRHSIHSSSDQTDYRINAAIAAASASLVTPEQCAVWSYPLKDGDDEEVAFNMVNSMLLRIHQSGHLAAISKKRFELVREAIGYYKTIRHMIPSALPVWPLGLPRIGDLWLCYGLRYEDTLLIAVWRLEDSEGTILLPLPEWKGRSLHIALAYPKERACNVLWSDVSGILSVTLPEHNTARIIQLTLK